jgi:hypothetical protein
LTLLLREFVRSSLGILGVLLRPTRLILLEEALSFLQPPQRLLGLGAAARATRRGLAHGVGGFLQTPLRISELLAGLSLPLGLAAKLLELPRDLLHFVSQRTLPGPGAGALPSAETLLPLLLLNLATRQLSQPLGQFVDLPLGFGGLAALIGPLLQLVLVGLAVLL